MSLEAPEMLDKETNSRKHAGVILKEERERQGLSLETVHEATKIPMDALRAIEEGYTIKILTSFYYKGFLKMYAKYLNVDIQGVLDEIPQASLTKRLKVETQPTFNLPKWLDENLTEQRKQQILAAVGFIVVFFLLIKGIGFVKQKWNAQPKKIAKIKPEQNQEPRVENDMKVLVEEEPVVHAPALRANIVASVSEPTLPQAPAVMQKSVSLTIRALKDSWLRIRVDGQVVYQSTLARGAVETWRADREIELTGKNISQLEFELNGKMIGGLGRKNRLAKEIVFTKDGLTVKL